MLSIYRLFGGAGLLLLGISLLPYTLPRPVKLITGICLVVAGVALLVGL
jgi:hypothetical protein